MTMSPIDVSFQLDLSGVLHVTASHRSSGKQASASIKHGPALRGGSGEEVTDGVAEIEAQAPAPTKSDQRGARAMLRRAQRVLDAAPEEAGDHAELRKLTRGLEQALESNAPADDLGEQVADALYELG